MFKTLLVAATAFTAQALPEPGYLQETAHAADGALCDNVKQYSGYYKLDTGRKNYFYWMFESRGNPSTDPVVLWLTGGPGCSSEVALFGENGPCKVSADGTSTTTNPYSWNSNANLIYVDQPTGTGFSYGKDWDHDEKGVATDMYDFLQLFFKAHPEYQKSDFFAFGESYAGHYVPAITHRIWKNNQQLPAGAIKINLVGTAVGNGLTDPEIQYAYYPDMGASTNGHPAVWTKDSKRYKVMKAAVKPCIGNIRKCQNSTAACFMATDMCNMALMMPYQGTGMNPYDMRIKCAKPPLCYDFSSVGTYLSQEHVQEVLGVKGRKWQSCNRAVAMGFEMGGDWMRDYQQMIPDQLHAGIRVLIYAGDQDYICNWMGNEAWVKALEWDHKDSFNQVALKNFTVDGEAAGSLRSSNGFSFLQVFNAGHMVPLDQPKAALAMMEAFIAKR